MHHLRRIPRTQVTGSTSLAKPTGRISENWPCSLPSAPLSAPCYQPISSPLVNWWQATFSKHRETFFASTTTRTSRGPRPPRSSYGTFTPSVLMHWATGGCHGTSWAKPSALPSRCVCTTRPASLGLTQPRLSSVVQSTGSSTPATGPPPYSTSGPFPCTT